jgi:hypothetical protein
MGGEVLITSAPGIGTSVRVEIPTNESNGDQTLPPPIEDHEESV